MKTGTIFACGFLSILTSGLIAGCLSAPAATEPPIVAAAASLRHAMPRIAEAFERAGGGEVVVTYGGSGDLQKQVEAGAPIDAVVFAAGAPVDALIEAGLVKRESRRVIASNTLVLAGPTGGRPLTFRTLDSLAPGELLALGDPRTVPAGKYAKESLEKLGSWKAVEPRAVFGNDVAAVLAYARRGEVAAAVVYRTDLDGITDAVLLDEASGDWAPRPNVVAGLTTHGAPDARAAAFVAFLAGPETQSILKERGFLAP